MKKIFVWLFAASPLLFTSCDNTTEVGTTLPSFDLSHVYVAGYRMNEFDYDNRFATVWHAGRETVISDSKAEVIPAAITTAGRKLYVVGTERDVDDLNQRAWLWNDGVREILPGGSYANGVYVSRDTAYVVGYSGPYYNEFVPLLWVKGERQELASDSKNAVANAVYVKQEVVPDGKDDKGNPKVKEIKTIYVAGFEIADPTYGYRRAVLWTNGEKKALESNNFPAVAQRVYMQDEDLYVTGYIEPGSEYFPVYWKNGVMQIISGPESLYSSSLWIQGKDIYVGGNSYSGAVLWENGNSRPLKGVTAGEPARINAVCADNTDYYAAGCDDNKAVLWLEGRRHNLTDRKTWATATAICPAP